MYQAYQDSFCDNKCHELLQLPLLLSTLNHIDNVANINKLVLIRSALLCGSILEYHLHHSVEIKYPRKLILIWDTGASYGLTLFRSDFFDYVKFDISVKDVTKINRAIGIGTTLHKFINSNGKEVFLPCVSYDPT